MQLHTYKSFSTLWAQINKIRNERGEITADTTEIQRKKKRDRIPWTVICQQLGQPRRNGRLSRNKPSRLNQKEIDNLNRWITSNKIEFVIKKHSQQT